MKFLQLHYTTHDGLRLGQRFVQLYIDKSWPELYYESELRAALLIQQWLIDHQYIDDLPRKV
jgi:hypothetical protein